MKCDLFFISRNFAEIAMGPARVDGKSILLFTRVTSSGQQCSSE
jgi:hypothetical protein